ncbi:MAG: hypothetical protein NTZ83_03875 [Candidatus Pacearchaeota archaeon]|nr:hypothetical protein [Candidatus Pacearchaeota archaeon]
MNIEELIKKKIAIAEKRVLELIKSEELKSILEQERYKISEFYEEKSKNRLESAKIIYNNSKSKNKIGISKDYSDYPEVISAAYYSMYYIVHSFVELKYRSAREIFTYNVSPNVEAENAEDALRIASEFTNTIRQLME